MLQWSKHHVGVSKNLDCDWRETTHQDDAFDDSVSVILGINFLQRQELVNDAFLLRVSATTVVVAPSPLVLDEAADERVARRLKTHQRRVDAAQAVHPAQRREEVPDAGRAARRERLLDDLLEPAHVGAARALPGDRAQHDVEHQLEQPGPERHRGAAAEQAPDERGDLGAAAGGPRGEAGRREDLGGEEPAHGAPVLAVGRPHHHRVPVPEPLARQQPRPARQRGVARGEALLGRAVRGHQQRPPRAQAQGQERRRAPAPGAMRGGERGQRAVQRLAEQVEVAEQRARRRARRDVAAPPTTFGQDGSSDEQGDEGDGKE
jgi:hypothetical protein